MEGYTLDRRTPVRGPNGPQAGLDFPLARQKHQDGFVVDALVDPVLFQGAQYVVLQPFALPGAQVVYGHRVAATLAMEHLGVRQLGRQGGQIQGGRHHHQPQLGAKQFSGLSHQCEGQITISGPLVEFIEHHAGHALQGRVRLKPAQK